MTIGHFRDIQPSGRDVAGDEDAGGSVTKMPQGCETLLLTLFAMQRFDRQRAFAQKLCQLLGLFDRIDKEDAAADRPGLQDG